MTVPVIVEKWNNATMSFVMPAGVSLDDTFTDVTSVKITTLAWWLYAVKKFSWGMSASRDDEMIDALLWDLSRDGFEVTGAIRTATYDGPFIPWPLRRNEVWVGIEG